MSKSNAKTHVGNVIVAPAHQKRAESEKIASDIALWQARGGKIEVLGNDPIGIRVAKTPPRGNARKTKNTERLFSKNKDIHKPDILSLQEAEEEENTPG